MHTHSKTIADEDLSLYSSVPRDTDRQSEPSPSHIESSFEIPSYIGFVAPAVDRIVRKIRRARCIPGKEEDISGALMEAIANAVIHGNRQRPDKRVHINVRYEPRKCLCITVRDEGAGFNPAAVPDPTRPENLASDHGRGILMMRAFMDDVRYERNGTECHLTKKCDNPVTATIKDYAGRAADFFHSHHRHHHHKS